MATGSASEHTQTLNEQANKNGKLFDRQGDYFRPSMR